jgi:hypothetical protein
LLTESSSRGCSLYNTLKNKNKSSRNDQLSICSSIRRLAQQISHLSIGSTYDLHATCRRSFGWTDAKYTLKPTVDCVCILYTSARPIIHARSLPSTNRKPAPLFRLVRLSLFGVPLVKSAPLTFDRRLRTPGHMGVCGAADSDVWHGLLIW